MMPGLSGIDVLRKIRATSGSRPSPVLLLSAKSRDTDVDTGFAVGADDYVIKPFSPRELLHRVNGVARPGPMTSRLLVLAELLIAAACPRAACSSIVLSRVTPVRAARRARALLARTAPC